MSYEFYKVLHLFLITCLFFVLGSIFYHYKNGASEKPSKCLSIIHGVVLTLILISGWGLIAKLKLPLDAWIWVKHLSWLGFGVFPLLARKLKKSHFFAAVFAFAAVVSVVYKF